MESRISAASANVKKAWVTLLTKDAYLPGALVLDYGLRKAASKYPLVVMISVDLPAKARDVLALRNIHTIEIGKLAARNPSKSIREERFAETWTKLRYVRHA